MPSDVTMDISQYVVTTLTDELAAQPIPTLAPNAPENIAALIADVDYWSKAIHEAALQLRRISEQLAQLAGEAQ